MAKESRYGIKRVAGGFDSGLERAVYELLLLREQKGEISEIKRQQSIVLQPGSQKTRITWRADFTFEKEGVLWACEAKGNYPNDVWPLKLKMIRYQKIKTEIWMGTAARPFLHEVIE